MPETYRITITAKILADLRGIFDYVKIDSPDNAAKLIEKILDSIDGLSTFPHRYRQPRNEVRPNSDIRSMPVRPYLVRYRIDEQTRTVFVLQIRHGARRRRA